MLIHPELALYVWMVVTLGLFVALRPRHAVLAAYIGAWLFLPMFRKTINVLPDLDKVTVTSFGVLFGTLIFDGPRMLSFRPRWYDLPMAVWCISPFFSSVLNGLGWWDGMSSILGQVVLWGIPYYVGRVYFSDWEGVRELALGVFLGGLIYVPFCLFEMKMSPQLHRWIYGYHQHSFAQHYRMGGYRPMVFMQSGLAVGFWMTAACLVGVWLWVSGALKRLWGVPVSVLVPALLVTTVMCKATASLLFLGVGLVTLCWTRSFRNALPLLALIAFLPAYITLRASGQVSGQAMVAFAQDVFGEERAQSLKVRVEAENLLAARALESPVFGWGRWSPDGKPKWRVYDEESGKDKAITDGMWVITMGTFGLVGLSAATLAILLPPLLLRRRVPVSAWDHPLVAPAAALAVMLVLHMLDNLLNAMLNPVFVMAMGGLGALGTAATGAAVSPAMRAAMAAPRGQPRGGFPVALQPSMQSPPRRVPLPMRAVPARPAAVPTAAR